jgi:hypothetical protein
MSGVGPQRAVERAQAIARAAEHRRRHRGRITWITPIPLGGDPALPGARLLVVGYAGSCSSLPVWLREHLENNDTNQEVTDDRSTRN